MATVGPREPTWTRHARPVDLAIVALTTGMAALTLWMASAPIAHFFDFLILGFIWLPIGAVWALSLIVVRRPTFALAALILLLLIFFSMLFGVGEVGGALTTVLIALVGVGGLLLVGGLVFGRAILLDRPHRIVWLVAPAIVLVTLALTLSGMPSVVRFALGEPALTAHAQEILDRPPVEFPEDMASVSVGGVTIDWSIAQGGCAHLVTTYTGILAENPAGLAYCPVGLPGDDVRVGEYEAFRGAWYRWFSRSEFPFD